MFSDASAGVVLLVPNHVAHLLNQLNHGPAELSLPLYLLLAISLSQIARMSVRVLFAASRSTVAV